MNRLLLLTVFVLVACQPSARRIVRSSSPPALPSCTVTLTALRITDVTCQGAFSRDELWRAALLKAAETGPEQGSLTFDVIDTNENNGWRALRAKFAGPGEPAGTNAIEVMLSSQQLEAARTRAMTKQCQRTVIVETDPATKASCMQFLAAQQQLAQTERHHAEQMGVQRESVEAQRQAAAAQQETAAALRLQAAQRSTTNVVIVGGSTCRSSLDCGSGEFCKDWSGGRVCMGNGGVGAPCSSGIDCAGSLFCRSGLCGQ